MLAMRAARDAPAARDAHAMIYRRRTRLGVYDACIRVTRPGDDACIYTRVTTRVYIRRVCTGGDRLMSGHLYAHTHVCAMHIRGKWDISRVRRFRCNEREPPLQ